MFYLWNFFITILGTTAILFAGIGDFIFFAPNNLLLQRINFNRSNYHQFTKDNTGVTTLDGLKIGLTYTAPVTWVDIMQQENAPIYFYTSDSLRMVIKENRSNMIYYPGSLPLNTNGFVGIGHSLWGQNFMSAYGPLSMMHLEGSIIF